jgi:uncharacterized protein (TIGR03435 family)
MKIPGAIAIALLVSMLAVVTAQDAKLEFEVASVRPSSREVRDGVVLGLRMDGAQARIGALTLRDYIAMAYRVKAYQVVGPDWISSERFDVNAKLPAGSTADQIPRMLQALLEERFGLAFHREATDMPVYALNIGKPPLKLKESTVDADAVTPSGAVAISASGSAAGVAVDLGNGSSYTFASGKFEAKKISGRMLADVLERYTDRPILDRTELHGTYDFSFEITPEDYQSMLIRAAVNSGVFLPPQVLRIMDNGGNPLPDALSQLGLRLDSARAPVELLVVDQARRTPTDN